MSLLNVFDIAGSGMSAQSVRLNITASNMANADSVSSSIDRTYRARHPVFQTILDEIGLQDSSSLGGVRVAGVVESSKPLRSEYQPDNPLADKDGYVHMSNVNIIEEMTNMIAASRSYQTNVEVVNASKQMLLRTLALGQ